MNLIKISKMLSYVLRHNPKEIGITLDKNGYANTAELISKYNRRNITTQITMDILEQVVREDDKGRYSFNDDKTKIRANQGHTLKNLEIETIKETDLELDYLYHGTPINNVEAILRHGLSPVNRNHVHLTANIDTAFKSGSRFGWTPVLIKVDVKKMKEKGYKFYKSENDVWLLPYVIKPEFLLITVF